MSKQDRQGVRTPADLERKYDFSQFTADEASVKKYGDQINRLNQTLAQFMSSTIATLEVMDEKDDELEASIEQLDGQDFYQSIMIDASGSFIRLYDSSPLAPKQYKIYGKTIQYGTPIPAAPIELVSICKYEGIEVTIGASEIDENPQRFVIPILNGFPGIPVEDGGDYTDGDGKHWIADHIDLIKKVYVQRIGAIDSYNGEEITTQFISNTGELSAEATVQYILPKPIEIDLSNIPELSALHTYKPRSIITNDADAWQTVTYVADTKTYVDNTSETEAAAGRVRYDTIQTLEDMEMEQARHNIGAASQIDVTMLTDRVDALGESGGGGGGADIEFPITIAQGGTGAITAADALSNLGGIPKCVVVQTAGTDLDDYRADGIYCFTSATTPTNIPSGVNGFLEVITAGDYTKQVWYRLGTPGTNDYDTWVRTYASNTGWGKWWQFMVTEDSFLTSKTLSLATASQTDYTVTSISAYCRSGVVDVHLQITPVTSATTWITVATLPSGYRPPTNIYKDVPFWNATTNAQNLRLRITTAGAVQLNRGQVGSAYAFHDTFVMA